VEGDISAKLYVSNLSHSITEAEFFQLFRRCGPICEVILPRDHPGIGFIQFESPEAAKAGITDFDNLAFQGLRITVKPAFMRRQARRYPAPNPKFLDAKYGWQSSSAPKIQPVAEPPPPPKLPQAPQAVRASDVDRKRKFDYPVYAGPTLTGGQSAP
jgi:RNA recognition motif-containing protein